MAPRLDHQKDTSEPPASGRTPRLAVYAGVFDPPTMAHLEIIETALQIFDELVVLIGHNLNKSGALFSPEERVRMLDASLTDEMRGRVRVDAHAGLTAVYAERVGACALVRGMRPYADADGEIALALMNQKLAPHMPTVLLVASSKNVYLSSSFVRQTAMLGGMIVPGSVSPAVEEALLARIAQEHRGAAPAGTLSPPGSASRKHTGS
jgi:pantetheine-phosphate adenylyltransferase